MLMLNISRVSIMILSVEVNAAELEEEDCRHQLQVNMGELPDQRIYRLFVAMDNAVTVKVGMGRRYLTAVTKKGLGTQRGPSNSVRDRYELLQVDAGPAAAAMLSPGPLKPPTCKKMNDKKPVAELYYEKPAKEQYYEKPAAKHYYEKPAPEPVLRETRHAALLQEACRGAVLQEVRHGEVRDEPEEEASATRRPLSSKVSIWLR